MGVKIEAVLRDDKFYCWTLRRVRDLLILTGKMRVSFKIDSGMRDEKQKIKLLRELQF